MSYCSRRWPETRENATWAFLTWNPSHTGSGTLLRVLMSDQKLQLYTPGPIVWPRQVYSFIKFGPTSNNSKRCNCERDPNTCTKCRFERHLHAAAVSLKYTRPTLASIFTRSFPLAQYREISRNIAKYRAVSGNITYRKIPLCTTSTWTQTFESNGGTVY